MKSRYPKVNIIVLNYNSRDRLRKCLAGLFSLDYPNFEVVVVDNNSKDGSLEKAKLAFSRATFIKNEQNLGFSAGNNVGIRYSLEKMAKFLLLISVDVEVERGFLGQLVACSLANTASGILSPLTLGADKGVCFSGGKIDWLRMKLVCEKKRPKNSILSVDFVLGCAMLIRSNVFAKIGLFDEDFFSYLGDVDFSCRGKRAGFEIMVLANTQIVCVEKEENPQKDQAYWQAFSRLLFFRKNAPRQISFWIRSLIFLGRIKNQIDVQRKMTKINLARQKAYSDLKELIDK